MITKTEILYAFSRLQEQDDLPENVNEFMRDAALSKLAGEELKEGGGMKTKEEILERLQKENPHSIPVFKAMDEYAAQFAGTREEWVSVEKNGYPKKNTGVLVFIPDEDNHITSGMWDVSEKWVLLDEYRIPECEVTHWRKLPNPPNINI